MFILNGAELLARESAPILSSMRSALRSSAFDVLPLLDWPLLSKEPASKRCKFLPADSPIPVLEIARGLSAAAEPALLKVSTVKSLAAMA